MARIAAVDVGTNTALLVVADFADARLVPLFEADRFVRLGEGVDRDRTITAAALDRLERVLSEFRRLADEHGATEGLVGATSASRDAANRAELTRRAERACGWPFEVLSGELEAALTFAGAASDVDAWSWTGPDAVIRLVDVGGGSTELVSGVVSPQARVLEARSANVGSVRVTERFLAGRVVTPDLIAETRRFVDESLAAAAAAIGSGPVLVTVGGTATTLVTLSGADGRVLDHATVLSWMERLMGMTPDAILALDPPLLRGREDVFAAGVLVLEAAMRSVGAERLTVSRRGLRHGLALRRFGAA